MNLVLFNKVNSKDQDLKQGNMYSEWVSLSDAIQNECGDSRSVLDKFSPGDGKGIASSVVKQLTFNLGITQPPEPSQLTDDREVQWCMEVICHGLSLPLNEPDVIRDCVNVYCDWLSALHPKPKISVPRPICEDPNMYARRIISHFHNLFVPRKGEGADTINRQAVLCHRVLRTLQHLAQVSTSLDRETWEALLIFLLSINNTLLAPPTVKDDVGDQLCERVLSVLLEVWLIACVRCFPSPPLWKTLREMAMMWRHRTPLIEQWNRVNLILTARLLDFMYGPSFPELKMSEEDMQLIPSEMSNDCIAQSWYRFLHTIGNPVDLCRPHIISQTRMFLQFALTNNNSDPTLHPCLSVLPVNFLKAIKGIASQVDAFLGIPSTVVWDVSSSVAEKVKPPTFSPTPPSQRRISKSFSVSSSAVTKGIPKASLIGITSSRLPSSGHPSTPTNSGPSSTSSLSSMSSIGPDARSLLASARPKCNSILRLFGEWLFEAAQIGSDLYKTKLSNMKSSNSSKRPSSVMIAETASISSSGSTRKGSGSLNLSQPNSLTEELDIPANLTSDRYQSGRAEALGALCRIFCSKKTGEEVHPLYLAKFYIALQQGLRISDNRECDETLASALLNSSDLLRLDLDGVHLLVPFIIDALEIVLPEKELKIKSSTISKNELRRASINLLLSILVLPLHFQSMVIKELNSTVIGRSPLRFIQLKPRLMNLLINALQVEKDPQNTQMLLGGLLLSVQDSAIFEDLEQSNQLDSMGGSETASNLLSSDSMSTFSLSSDIRNHGHDGVLTDGSLDSANFIFSDINEYPYFLSSSNSKNFAHALFRRATDLVCHCLIYSWKTDLNVSLAALELLSGLAQTHIKETDAQECKIIVKWICDYISNQCSRPPPAHSKDLHSTIVAAFQCTSTWLIAHPYLLQDKESLSTVLEVVELGISGSKSLGRPGEPPKLKDNKDLKPASMRVRDAAEALLTLILEQVGNFPSPCGAESISCLLDEVSLVKQCNLCMDSNFTQKESVGKFRYFIVDNAIMLALLEEPLGNDQDPQPTITILIRSPFGRYAWTLQLRFLPRYRSPSKHHHSSNPGRPIPIDEPQTRQTIRQRYFSDIMERIPPCKIDQSIPKLESFLVENVEYSELCQLIDQQHSSEKHAAAEEKPSPEYEKECAPPSPCDEFQTARLFLSHFGFLARLDEKQETPVPPLITLDSKHANFCDDLRALDCVSERTHDTCHVFYVRANQKSHTEILNNVLSESMVSPQFFEILHSLGWPVAVGSHPGWTGHVNSSWKISEKSTSETKSTEQSEPLHGGCLYNGKTQVLYWADASSEIAFVVPTLDSNSDATQVEKDTKKIQGNGRTHSPADADNTPKTSSPHISSESNRKRLVNPITTLMLVWLESFEDHLTFPVEDLLPYTDTGQPGSKTQDCFIVYLHALNSGLLRVKLVGPPGRMSVATPLVDGMVISRRVAGSLVRQTVLNMCRRRRLDSDSYHPPHVRRRLKIQEIANKYHIQMTAPELLTHLINQNN